jgi:hypothetical protein
VKGLIWTTEKDKNMHHSQSGPSNCLVQMGLWSVDWNIMGTLMAEAPNCLISSSTT